MNKVDLAPDVGADLSVMRRDAAARRDDRPTLFTDLSTVAGAAPVAGWIRGQLAR